MFRIKRAFVLDPPTNLLPLGLGSFTSKMEETIVSSLIREINEVYDLSLDEKPDLDRELDPAPFHDTGRTVIIGSSHMKRIASHMAAEASLVDFSVPGRIANSESIE